jgi:protocatechuate 3,4-dioxygenase, alpha subunit
VNTTPSQTVGPYYPIGLCRRPDSELDANGIELYGRLLDGQDDPIADGLIEVWDPKRGRWGRSDTDADGRFSFLVPRDCAVLEAFVFARGLLRHQRTRVHLDDGAAAEDQTLVALRTGDGYLFDIRMQGDQATLFFAH